jgi:predicted  nucleic acid-binding Zn-ribbon protein
MRIMSMGRWIVMLGLAGAGCADRHRAEVRWPDHRKAQEKRITDLEAYKGELGPQIQRLERRIAELEKEIREARETAPR